MNYFQVKTIKNLLERKKGYLWLAIMWTLFMAYLCLTDFNKLPTIRIGGLDKSVHVILHFFFTSLWYLYLSSSRIIKKNQVLVVGIASVFYGAIIEVAQALFTTTRKADVVDVFANSVGTIAACFVAVYLIYRSKETNFN